MTKTEIATISRAITILRSLVDKPPEGRPPAQHSPVTRFAQEYLAPDPDADFGCEELWKFFHEIVQAGQLPPMRRVIFLRELPEVMEAAFNLRKCHNIERSGRRVRGFRGITIKPSAGQPPAVEAEIRKAGSA